MNILVLSFYYPPDLSAGSFRTKALVDALTKATGEAGRIDVVTTLPNRYRTFVTSADNRETFGRVQVTRVALPMHRSGMRDQALAFAVFAWKALWNLRGKQYDLVYATSSRLFTAFLGALCSIRTKAPLYLDIRDIFVDTINDVLPRRVARLAMPLLKGVECFTVTRASRINLVSEGFRDYFHSRYPEGHYVFFTNGVDEEFVRARFDPPQRTEEGRPTIVYAGNFGEGQGLHRIIPSLAKRLPEYDFQLVGDGGRKDALVRELEVARLTNVRVLPPVPRERLLELYRDAVCLFLHLNDYEAFRKVLPSKIFEYAATGKPILAGLAGYPAEFLTRHVENAAVFPPCDVEAAVRALRTLRLAPVDRSAFIERFDRGRIMNAMASDVMALAVQAGKL